MHDAGNKDRMWCWVYQAGLNALSNIFRVEGYMNTFAKTEPEIPFGEIQAVLVDRDLILFLD